MDGDDGALGPGPVRHRTGGDRAGDQDMAAGQLEEALDILDEGALAAALPGHAAGEAELAALTDGANGPDVAHGRVSTKTRPVRFN